MSPQFQSKVYHYLLPMIAKLPTHWQIRLASWGRQEFMHNFIHHHPKESIIPHSKHTITMWGIEFRAPLANSAGMFKNGEGYDTVAKLGAGAYIGGTSTANSRVGNLKNGISLPFISLYNSKAAINFLGLPNLGDQVLSQINITSNKIKGCPIGWSVMRSPDYDESEGLSKLIDSLWLYHNHPQIDFIEINESCPNIKIGGGSIIPRLQIIAQEFLDKRTRKLPVVIKLSTDLSNEGLAPILEELLRLNFDGINLGNTSIDYGSIKPQLNLKDEQLFDYFTQTFGGGVSGLPLKSKSLQLCAEAADLLNKFKPNHEFHIIRSGGIDSLADIGESQAHGVSFNQWYTGFFNSYARDGDKVYNKLFT
ncbi:MAG: hypothetical protein K2X04_04260 [Burkholderiales bacterium]|nr:hypothetical protein [Burkholderiales bacterium]